MWGTFGASAFLAAHQMLQGGFSLDDPCSGLGPCSLSSLPRCSVSLGHTGDMATSLGTATHSALSWRCSCGRGEGHLFGAAFNVMLIVSLALVIPSCPELGPMVKHSAFAFLCSPWHCPWHRPWHCPWQVVLAAGCQHLGMLFGMALCQCRACGMSLWDEAAGPAPARRSQGSGEQGELREWISCRA